MLKLVYDPETGEADLAIDGGRYAEDSTRRTMVLLTIGIDSRADEDEVPAGSDRGGWWAEPFMGLTQPIGSKLWLVEREKNTARAESKAHRYAEDAFAWWIEAGLADRVDVTVERGERFIAVYPTIYDPSNPNPSVEDPVELLSAS